MDIIAVGTQECEYSAKSTKPTDTARFLTGATQRLHNWWGQVLDHIGEEWVPVACQQLLEMKLIVFARQNVSAPPFHTRNTRHMGTKNYLGPI